MLRLPTRQKEHVPAHAQVDQCVEIMGKHMQIVALLSVQGSRMGVMENVLAKIDAEC